MITNKQLNTEKDDLTADIRTAQLELDQIVTSTDADRILMFNHLDSSPCYIPAVKSSLSPYPPKQMNTELIQPD